MCALTNPTSRAGCALSLCLRPYFVYYSLPAFQHIACPLRLLLFQSVPEYSTSSFIYKDDPSSQSRRFSFDQNTTPSVLQHYRLSPSLLISQSTNRLSPQTNQTNQIQSLVNMCLVQLHKSSKSASYKDMADYAVPARIVTTAYSGSSDEKHQKAQVINAPARRSSMYIDRKSVV